MTTYTLPQNLGDILGAHHDGNLQTQVSEIKAGIGVLQRGTILAIGTAGDIGKLVKLTAGTEAQAYGILLDPQLTLRRHLAMAASPARLPRLAASRVVNCLSPQASTPAWYRWRSAAGASSLKAQSLFLLLPLLPH